MDNVSFTIEDAQRISDAVTAMERGKYAVKPIDYTSQGDEFVVINVTATTKFSDGTQDGNLSFWNEETHLYEGYSPTQTVRVRTANTADVLPVGYVFARFQGNTTRSSVVGPLYIAISFGGSGSGSGGSATIEVVTDVICTPTGIEVSTVTLSGADYDNAVIKQFLALSDVTPSSYLGNQNRVVKVNSTATALEFGAIGEGPFGTTFIALTDTPNVYGTASTYYSLTVNSANSALVFSGNDVSTEMSVFGGGNPNDPYYAPIKLKNDQYSPGNYYSYSTNASGVKGWNLQAATPAGLTVGGIVVVSAQKAAVTDVAAHTISSVDLATAASTTQTAIDDLTAQVNLLLARIRSHGLIS